MVLPGSTYWNMVHGMTPDEVREDKEYAMMFMNPLFEPSKQKARLDLEQHLNAKKSKEFKVNNLCFV